MPRWFDASTASAKREYRELALVNWTSQLGQSVRLDIYRLPLVDQRHGGGLMAGGKTGKTAASAAGKTLASKTASKAAKSAAASDLAQVGNNKATGAKAASAAGKTLSSKSASKASKSAAASDLAQRGRERP
jgi:hypothetical protein